MWPPQGSCLLRVMATPHSLACLLCASRSSRPVRLSPGAPAHQPLAPSSAPDGSRSREACSLPPPASPAPACKGAIPPALTAIGTADAATAASPAPTGRPFHVRGSLLSGARKAYPVRVTLSRVIIGCLGLAPVQLDHFSPEFTGRFSAHETVSQGAGVDYHAIHTMSSTLSGRGTDSPYGPGQYPVSQRYERPAGSRGPASHPRDPNLLLILTMERSALI
jgi:hypothetical protein